MIQFIVTDLDNTLLNNNKEISRYSADIIKRCQEKGIRIAFATARPERATRGMQKSIQLDYIISNNGATISCKGEVIYNNIIAADVIGRLLLKLIAMSDVTHITVEAGDGLYTNYTGEPWDRENWNPVFHDFEKPLFKPVSKVSVETQNAQALRDAVSAYRELHLYHNSEENWYQVMHVDSTKMKAIRYLSLLTNIPVQDVAAFGDDFNDVDMLQNCGIGIAVANSNAVVKQAADDSCPGNQDYGVAKWLSRHLL